MKIGKWLGRKIRPLVRRLIMRCLPQGIRFKVYRNMIRLSLQPPEGIRFKIAETREELSQAFGLLHQAYVSQGLMDPHPSGMRVTKYHALPSTTTLIALKGDKVVATVSLIRSNPFGLPCEKAYDLGFLKKRRARLAEVSALAIDPAYSHQHGELLWALLKFMLEYSTRYFGIDYYVMIVHPVWFEFYEAILFFERFTARPIRYDFVKGAPGVGGFLDLNQVSTMMESVYSAMPAEKNIFRLFVETRFAAFEFPVRRGASVSDPVMTPQLLDHFFNQVTDGFSGLTEDERKALHVLYTTEEHRRVLPPLPEKVEIPRHAKRFEVECSGRLLVPGSSELALRIKNVSLTGVGVLLSHKLRAGEVYSLQIELGGGETAELSVMPVWETGDGACGLSISRASSNWRSFIGSMDQVLLRAA